MAGNETGRAASGDDAGKAVARFRIAAEVLRRYTDKTLLIEHLAWAVADHESTDCVHVGAHEWLVAAHELRDAARGLLPYLVQAKREPVHRLTADLRAAEREPVNVGESLRAVEVLLEALDQADIDAPIEQAPRTSTSPGPTDGVELLTEDRAVLRWRGQTAEVTGPVSVWLVNRAWESRGSLIPWSSLLLARYEWDGRLEPIREAARGHAVDGSRTEGAAGAQLVGVDRESLARTCRRLKELLNEQLGCDALTTEGGLMLAAPEQPPDV